MDIAKLRYYMQLKRITQRDLADSVGVSRTTISAYFTHKTIPDIQFALAISEKLDIPMLERGEIFLQSNLHESKVC